MLSELFYLSFLDRYISNSRSVWLVSIFIEIPVFNTNIMALIRRCVLRRLGRVYTAYFDPVGVTRH